MLKDIMKTVIDDFINASDKTYIPGMIRAAAFVSLYDKHAAQMIFTELGIKNKNDLLAVRRLIRDVDYDVCVKLFAI